MLLHRPVRGLALMIDDMTEKETWMVTWFPPDLYEKTRTFYTEEKARKFAAS